ncbi:MAG: TerB family tellurite resistance protein [Thermodesulfobacteriota bacterium]
MLSIFKKLFEGQNNSGGGGDNVARLRTATCVILLEAATADGSISDVEQKKVFEILKARFGMTDEAVKELIDESKRARQDQADIWYFTHLINQGLTIDEKYELMEEIWEVIYSDGTLGEFENYVAQKLYRMLNIDHAKFIELKLKVKNEIEGDKQDSG